MIYYISISLGYDFDEYEEIDLIGDNLECLCCWPSDIEKNRGITSEHKRSKITSQSSSTSQASSDSAPHVRYEETRLTRLINSFIRMKDQTWLWISKGF